LVEALLTLAFGVATVLVGYALVRAVAVLNTVQAEDFAFDGPLLDVRIAIARSFADGTGALGTSAAGASAGTSVIFVVATAGDQKCGRCRHDEHTMNFEHEYLPVVVKKSRVSVCNPP
jgi:hypothetical protein